MNDRRVPSPGRAEGTTYISKRTGKKTFVYRGEGFPSEIFEQELAKIGLSKQDIEQQQDPLILQKNLRRLDQLIEDPELLDVYTNRDSDGQLVRISPVPILLERKSLVLGRLSALSREQDLVELKQVVGDAVQDAGAAEKLVQIVQEQVTQSLKDQESLHAQMLETNKAKQEMMLFEVGITERKSAMYRKWLERESVASIVGAFLLLVLGIALVVAMFSGTAPTEIITSAFLLILGYFFGQATSKSKKSGGSDASEE